jgi:quercetin dioxygenase-like cupin family protein
VRMTSDGDANDATTGDLLTVPDARHGLEALQDSVVLLTVAKLP